MRLQFVTALLFFFYLAGTATTNLISAAQLGRCGSEEPSVSNIRVSETLAQEARLDPAVRLAAKKGTLKLDIYFHVISAGENETDGNLREEILLRQLSVVNADFVAAGISFNLVNISRTINGEWFTATPNSPEEREMKEHLRQGSYQDINTYFTNPQDSILGWCTLPTINPTAVERTNDGCVVSYLSLPGGQMPYDLGRTLTHEIGHWFNLYHTFQGGCMGGDMVDDTPAEGVPNFGCPSIHPDTCKGRRYPGVDPIHNFMDYSDDLCMSEFTPGQVTRMFQSFARFRGRKD